MYRRAVRWSHRALLAQVHLSGGMCGMSARDPIPGLHGNDAVSLSDLVVAARPCGPPHLTKLERWRRLWGADAAPSEKLVIAESWDIIVSRTRGRHGLRTLIGRPPCRLPEFRVAKALGPSRHNVT